MSTDPGFRAAERLAWVALSRLVEPGRRSLLGATADGAAALLERVLSGSRDRVSRGLQARLAGVDPWERAEADLAAAARAGVRAITPVDPDWPAEALSDLAPLAEAEQIDVAPPLCLWVRGPLNLARTFRRSVAIVGARAATAYGKHVAADLAYGLAGRGWVVVSGGAFGIDGAAHRGALNGQGATVAVLAGGVDVPYPLAHAAMLERIAEDGLLVSEVPLGESPQRHRFLSRNRLVAAFGAGLVVVEAGARSGTSVTAERAHQFGRVLMAVPGAVTSAQSVGTHRLIRDCGAVLVTSALEVIEEVGPIGVLEGDAGPHDPAGWDATLPGGPRGREALPGWLRSVLEAIPAGRTVTVEDIALAGRLAPTEVRRALPTLRSEGYVRMLGDGYRLTEAALGPPTFSAAQGEVVQVWNDEEWGTIPERGPTEERDRGADG
ncbi:DNA-processing protein DprA [Cryptosporangium phraense]|uniref:DNA-processing protein DprA n=1 Tax=Cryptosporangium phraense TaxID=2593070 RepID=UPI00197A8584|nr:DNA-processing protein DprA [Cryptosporangium phraense]